MVGGATKALILGQRLSPRLVDALMQTRCFEVHYTDKPKSEDAPDNLHASLGYEAVEGSFSDRQHPSSLYTWLELRPAAKGPRSRGRRSGRWPCCARGRRTLGLASRFWAVFDLPEAPLSYGALSQPAASCAIEGGTTCGPSNSL
jgi:hypothetical protein